MFIESNKSPNPCFKIPLAKALHIYQETLRKTSGFSKTLRGPVVTNEPVKLLIDDVAEIAGEKVFVLKFLQSVNPDLVGKTFFAKYDETATRFDQLKPAFGESKFFFEKN
jgi:hypothetical protein